MKKILALTLSAVLAMGMMTTALAADGGEFSTKGKGELELADDKGALWTDTEETFVLGGSNKMEPGTTYKWIVSGVSKLYYTTDSKDKVNLVTEKSSGTKPIASAEELFDIIDDNMATLKVSTEYGKEYVDSIKLEKKVDEYQLVITTKDTLSTKDGEFGFELTLKSKGKSEFNDVVLTVKKIKIGYEVFDVAKENASGMDVGSKSSGRDGNIVKTEKMDATEDFEFTFGDDIAMFVVDLDENDGKKNVAYTTKPNDALIDANPTALMQFFAGKAAPKFNNIGDLYLYADQDTYKYVYEITADGSLKAVNAKYDEDEEAYLIKTRQIGSYVMSDVELVGAATPSTPTVPGETSTVPGETSTVPGVDGTGKPNPETGANDMVNVAVAMAVVSLAAAGAVAFKKSSK